MDFDFGASTLTLTCILDVSCSWQGFGDYVFSGFDSTITGLSILSNTGFWGDLVSGAFSFTADSITLGMLTGSAWSGAVLVFDIQTVPVLAPVPEPGTLLLLGSGLAGLGVRAWRKRRKLAGGDVGYEFQREGKR